MATMPEHVQQFLDAAEAEGAYALTAVAVEADDAVNVGLGLGRMDFIHLDAICKALLSQTRRLIERRLAGEPNLGGEAHHAAYCAALTALGQPTDAVPTTTADEEGGPVSLN